jgi:hypothetical protein
MELGCNTRSLRHTKNRSRIPALNALRPPHLAGWTDDNGIAMSLTEDDKQWISEQLKAERAHADERLEATETKLLTAFHSSASPNGRSYSESYGCVAGARSEQENLAARVKKIEDQ